MPTQSPTELLDELRKEERQWRTARWSHLLTSVAPIIGNLYLLSKYRHFVAFLDRELGEKSLEAAFYLSISVTIASVITLAGAFGAVYVLTNWRGSRTRQLLILIAERAIEGDIGRSGALPNTALERAGESDASQSRWEGAGRSAPRS